MYLAGAVAIKPKHVTSPVIMKLEDIELPAEASPERAEYERQHARFKSLVCALSWATVCHKQ